MTEENRNQTKISVFSFVWLVVISLFFVSLGIKLHGESGYTIAFDTVKYENIKDMIMSVSLECMADIAMFLLVTVSAKPVVSLVTASLVLVFRGVTLGTCATFCAENAVNSASVAMIISYAMISAILLLYTVAVNRINSGVNVRLVLYLLVTGTAVALRVLPMLLV